MTSWYSQCLRSRVLLLIACGLAMAATVWALLGPPFGAATPPLTTAVDHQGAEAEPEALPGDTRGQPAEERMQVAAGGSRGSPQTRRVRVIAVLLPDQVPAAGAEVLYWAARTDVQRQRDLEHWYGTKDLESTLRSTGQRAIADDRGVAEIDVEDDTTLAVRCGDFYGESDLTLERGPPQLGVRVGLRRDVTLRVAVSDETGRPCSGIQVYGRGAFSSRRSGNQDDRELEFRLTDEDGLATVPHMQCTLPLPDASVVDWSLRLSCGGLHLAAVTRAAGWQEILAPDPIRLVLPAGGDVVLEVVDLDGEPVSCRPVLFDPASDKACTPTRQRWRSGYLFGNVPLGRTWRAFSDNQTAKRRSGPPARDDLFSTIIAGPTRPGETVRHRIIVEQHAWRIRGQIRRSDGVVLGGARLALSTRSEDAGTMLRKEQRTGYQAEFDISFALPGRDARLNGAVLEVTHPLDPAVRTIAIDRELPPGTTDLGAIVVPVPPGDAVLASIEVRCDGRAITDRAWVGLRLAADDNRLVPTLRHRDGERLVFHGTPPGQPMVVVCGHPECLRSEPIPVAVGADVVVDLQRAAGLWIAVLPPEVPGDLLHADLIAMDGARREPDVVGMQHDDVFHWEAVRPGRYRLRLLASRRILYETSGIELHPGTNVWPEGGTPLDLRGSAHAIHMPVSQAGSRLPVDYLQRIVIPAGGTELPDGEKARLESGDWIVVPEDPADLLFSAPGFVPRRLPIPSQDTRVWMQRCTQVHILPPPGDDLAVHIDIAEDAVRDAALRQLDSHNLHGAFDTVPGTGPIEVAYAPGTVLQIRVYRNGVADRPQRVVVGEVGPQEVTLR